MDRKGKIVQARFGNRVSRLPPELGSLLRAEKKKRMWRTYFPLWAGAVAIGLVVGGGQAVLRETPAIGEVPGPAIAPETVWEEKPTADDQDWALQASVTSAGTASNLSPQLHSRNFSFCHSGGGTNCVVDGDTIWMDGQKVRVADIDAPETHDYRCPAEKALGDRATQRLIELVNSGPVSLQPIDRDEDVYGRKLRIVRVNGASVGDTLVGEGLARYYEGGRKPWC